MSFELNIIDLVQESEDSLDKFEDGFEEKENDCTYQLIYNKL